MTHTPQCVLNTLCNSVIYLAFELTDTHVVFWTGELVIMMSGSLQRQCVLIHDLFRYVDTESSFIGHGSLLGGAAYVRRM